MPTPEVLKRQQINPGSWDHIELRRQRHTKYTNNDPTFPFKHASGTHQHQPINTRPINQCTSNHVSARGSSGYSTNCAKDFVACHSPQRLQTSTAERSCFSPLSAWPARRPVDHMSIATIPHNVYVCCGVLFCSWAPELSCSDRSGSCCSR
jgi:hypothetical protein